MRNELGENWLSQITDEAGNTFWSLRTTDKVGDKIFYTVEVKTKNKRRHTYIRRVVVKGASI